MDRRVDPEAIRGPGDPPPPPPPSAPRCRVTIELEIVGFPVAARARVDYLLTAGPLQRLIDSERGLLVTSAVVSKVEEL